MRYHICHQNWNSFYAPVTASVVFERTAKELRLLFEVEEPLTLARHLEHNSPVAQDSCVEFFYALGDGHYGNIECSAIGTLLAEYGRSREDRQRRTPADLAMIQITTSLPHTPIPEPTHIPHWSVALRIPIAFLSPASLASGNHHARSLCGNFYKCGDLLPQKHYLSAFPICTPRPDFHCPEWFVPLPNAPIL